MIELCQNDFSRCLHMKLDRRPIEPFSVLLGHNNGRVFVDDKINPSLAVVWLGNLDGMFFLGSAASQYAKIQFHSFFPTIINMATDHQRDVLDFLAYSPFWERLLPDFLSDKDVCSWTQLVFTYEKKVLPINDAVISHDHGRCLPVRDMLCQAYPLANRDYLEKEIMCCWPSKEAFLKLGLGYGVVVNHTLVSLCFTSFVCDEFDHLSIHTNEAYRGRGMAYRTATACIAESLKRKRVPYWDCYDENTASVALANKLGFVQKFSFLGYEYTIG